MTPKEILSHVDHTLLGVTATGAEFIQLCDEGLHFGVASVCVPPSRVKLCADHVAGKLAVCTVVGFPNGYADSEAKAREVEVALRAGAVEIDMVIDIGKAKEGDFAAVLADIKKVRAATGTHILKVIIETALLTEAEKIKLCEVVGQSGADYIKTSTGFAQGGATFEDVALLRKHSPAHVKVKAAGGIASMEDARRFIELGADRLGTSRIVKIVQGLEGAGY
ncbi:MAG: deoxyribose-phosphate aldolase [Defluviitaleaceae bacterium]|nr:deoxyribose-phosphate aldolase [Defluviitaleaceae bacterium]MCL2240200.1 deoxyribose-phosphate aldolase [Defluviitaleaceae bacterium]